MEICVVKSSRFKYRSRALNNDNNLLLCFSQRDLLQELLY